MRGGGGLSEALSCVDLGERGSPAQSRQLNLSGWVGPVTVKLGAGNCDGDKTCSSGQEEEWDEQERPVHCGIRRRLQDDQHPPSCVSENHFTS